MTDVATTEAPSRHAVPPAPFHGLALATGLQVLFENEQYGSQP
jgi:hypothetical protein